MWYFTSVAEKTFCSILFYYELSPNKMSKMTSTAKHNLVHVNASLLLYSTSTYLTVLYFDFNNVVKVWNIKNCMPYAVPILLLV